MICSNENREDESQIKMRLHQRRDLGGKELQQSIHGSVRGLNGLHPGVCLSVHLDPALCGHQTGQEVAEEELLVALLGDYQVRSLLSVSVTSDTNMFMNFCLMKELNPFSNLVSICRGVRVWPRPPVLIVVTRCSPDQQTAA